MVGHESGKDGRLSDFWSPVNRKCSLPDQASKFGPVLLDQTLSIGFARPESNVAMNKAPSRAGPRRSGQATRRTRRNQEWQPDRLVRNALPHANSSVNARTMFPPGCVDPRTDLSWLFQSALWLSIHGLQARILGYSTGMGKHGLNLRIWAKRADGPVTPNKSTMAPPAAREMLGHRCILY